MGRLGCKGAFTPHRICSTGPNAQTALRASLLRMLRMGAHCRLAPGAVHWWPTVPAQAGGGGRGPTAWRCACAAAATAASHPVDCEGLAQSHTSPQAALAKLTVDGFHVMNMPQMPHCLGSLLPRPCSATRLRCHCSAASPPVCCKARSQQQSESGSPTFLMIWF